METDALEHAVECCEGLPRGMGSGALPLGDEPSARRPSGEAGNEVRRRDTQDALTVDRYMPCRTLNGLR